MEWFGSCIALQGAYWAFKLREVYIILLYILLAFSFMYFNFFLINIRSPELQKYPRTLQSPTHIHNILLIEHIVRYNLNLRSMINFHNSQLNNLLIFFIFDLTRASTRYILFMRFYYDDIIVDEIQLTSYTHVINL